MLVVFHCPPRTAPGKAVFEEEAVAQVALLYLILKLLLAVGIGLAI